MQRRVRKMKFTVLVFGLLLAGCASQMAPTKTGGLDEPDAGGCVTAGCSSQLCVDAKQGDMASTCEWTEAYACYQKAGVCARLGDGMCGWVPTKELNTCLDTAKKGAVR